MGELLGRATGTRLDELEGRDRTGELDGRATAPFIGRMTLPIMPPALGQ